MFNSSRSLFSTLFTLLALSNALAFAAPHQGKHHGTGDVAHKITGTALDAIERRYDNARFTYYDAGQNACGGYDSNTDHVIAISPSLYNNGAHCYKSVTVQYNGKQVRAKVTDECPGCNGAEADLSRPLFAALAPLDEGVVYGQWWYN